MKSKTFSKHSLGESHIESLKHLIQLNNDNILSISNLYNDWEITPDRLGYQNPEDLMQRLNTLGGELVISSNDIIDIFNFGQKMIDLSIRNEDEINCLVEDFVIQGAIEETDKEKIITFLDNIEEKSRNVYLLKRRDSYIKGEIPTLKEMEYDVDIRFIPKKRFDPFETEIEEYKPEGDDLFPVAIIGLILSDRTKDFSSSFQVNFSQLEDLILHLQACQKEMRLIEKYSKTIEL